MTTPPGAEPLVVPPPSLVAGRAVEVAEREFDTPGSVTALTGERDQNFRLDGADGESYLLKVSSPADGPEILDLQNGAMRHAARAEPDLPVMQPIRTVDGEDWATVAGPEDEPYRIRLFEYLPGRTPAAAELGRESLRGYGEAVARTGRALQGFFHPAADYDILWDLGHTPALRPLLDSVADEERRALAERTLDRYAAEVEPVFEGLPAQVIHNDLTLDNVLLDGRDRVSGVIDFGDLTHTARVCDLAIALASATYRRDDPLEAAEAVVRGYTSVAPLEDREARLLGPLMAARLAAWGVIVAWRLDEHPEKTDHTVGGVDEGWAMLRRLEAIGPDVVARRLRIAARQGRVPYGPMATDDLLDRRRAVLGSSPLSYDEPVHFVGGEGVWLVDPEGRRYLDAYNNVQVVGHANPRVADAIADQARTLATNTRYLHESAAALGERLLATLPDPLDRVFLVNSGSEAIDLAWRLATAATGNGGALVSPNAYHGITEAAAALSPEIWPAGGEPEHVETVLPPADHPRGHTAADAVESARDAIGSLEAHRGVAAFVFDTMFTSDGILPPDAEALGQVADRVREAGGLVVADEVQAGLGRTGPELWGFEETGLTPDVVAMGKPLGNGHPVAAVATRSSVASTLMDRTGLFSTFGGNPVSCAAALAVLDVLEDEALPARAVEVGDRLRSGVADLADEHACIGDVRGRGLMTGVELVADRDEWTPATEAARSVVEALRQRRVLIGATGPDHNVLKIRPPLAFEAEHADRLLAELDAALGQLD